MEDSGLKRTVFPLCQSTVGASVLAHVMAPYSSCNCMVSYTLNRRGNDIRMYIGRSIRRAVRFPHVTSMGSQVLPTRPTLIHPVLGRPRVLVIDFIFILLTHAIAPSK